MPADTDEALIKRFRQTKDTYVFKSLVKRYQNRIFNTCYRILGNVEEAEEVVQDTYIKIHEGIDQFKEKSSFASWVFRIAYNICMDSLRLKQRRARQGLQLLSFDPQSVSEETADRNLQPIAQAKDTSLSPEEKLDLSEQSEMVANSLSLLPELQRTAIILCDLEGFSYQEIADIVGASIGTVRSRIYYGRTRLKELLEPYFASSNTSPTTR
jgi:RNA polymerase sigma-70 factor (ECF subfamily)